MLFFDDSAYTRIGRDEGVDRKPDIFKHGERNVRVFPCRPAYIRPWVDAGNRCVADLADIRPGCPGTFGKTFPTRARARNSSKIDPDGLDGFTKTSPANELKRPSMPGRTPDGTTWPDGFFR